MWFALILVLERFAIQRRIRAVPLRVTVTGTRGKSTVVRLLASVLREDGRVVLAKTTGSEARIILPDGSEKEVSRNVSPSVLEQKKFMSEAARLHADCTVAEVMSIHAENHRTERRILQPEYVLITNVREDHTESMGKTQQEIAGVFAEDIPDRARVFVPAFEMQYLASVKTDHPDQEWFMVEDGNSGDKSSMPEPRRTDCFQEQIDLVYAVGRHLDISPSVIFEGIQNARLDAGALRIWQVPLKGMEETEIFCVNAFAANDPESTERVLNKVKTILGPSSKRVIGLLSLRRDRGDRTRQWTKMLAEGMDRQFDRLIVMGDGAQFVRRHVPRAESIKGTDPEKIMGWLAEHVCGNEIVFGYGNMKGAGLRLVQLWDRTGKSYAV